MIKDKNCYEGNTCQRVFPLFQEYRNELLGFINRRLQDETQSEALVSDVLIKMHRHCEQLEHVKNIRAWLFQVTRNTMNDYFRERSKNSVKTLNSSDTDLSWEPDEQLTLAALIPSLLHCLPPKYAQPLEMSDLQGMPQMDIAKTLNLSLSGAKSRIQRGRRQLKSLFHECLDLELDQRGIPIHYSIKPDCSALQNGDEQVKSNCSC